MSCCTLDENEIKSVLAKNVDFVTKIASTSKLKEMKMFNNVCKGYKLGKEDEYIVKLCNERVRVYMNNDNTLEKIRQCLVLCDTVIKTIEFNQKILRQMNGTDSDDDLSFTY